MEHLELSTTIFQNSLLRLQTKGFGMLLQIYFFVFFVCFWFNLLELESKLEVYVQISIWRIRNEPFLSILRVIGFCKSNAIKMIEGLLVNVNPSSIFWDLKRYQFESFLIS